MEKIELAEEIINFCVKYRLLGNPKRIIKSKDRVIQELDNVEFVESLISVLIKKSKYINMDNKSLENLLAKLEEVRLDLE
ncbi:MAG: hypothetical protein FWE04_03735 [Oscillospiraceae bacterium]|nr:hypothetical protein [Oscillospiraceae bacterium]